MTAGVVLIADSDPFDAKLLDEVVTAAGFSVLAASTRAQLFEALAERRVDAIVLDLDFDEGAGLDVLRQLQVDGLPETPILMIGRDGDADSRDAGMSLGAADYLTKPFRISEVGRRLRNSISLTSRRASQPPPRSPLDSGAHVESIEQLAMIVEYEHVRAQRYEHDLSVVIVQIRGEAGAPSTSSRAIIETVTSCLRGADQLHRVGAELFVLILPETGCSVHGTIGDRIENALRGAVDPKLEIQIGGACTGEDDVTDPESLVRKALHVVRASATG